MAKRMGNDKTMQFTAKVHRQHSSLTVTVPKGLCKLMEVEKGNILLFEIEKGDVAAIVGKLSLRGVNCGRDNRDSDCKDKGR